MVRLKNELAKIKGIDKRFLTRLQKLKIISVKDLLWHFPSRYDDFSQIANICDLEPDQIATVQGQIKNISSRRTWRRKMIIVEAIIADDTGSIKAIWFNQPYLSKVLAPGRVVNFAGKISSSQNDIYFSNPIYEFSGARDKEESHTAGLIPVYPETKGLTSRGLRYLIKIILKNLTPIDEFIPQAALKENDLPEINKALSIVHFPESLEEASRCKKRFAFEDLFLLQLNNLRVRSQLAKEKAAAIDFSKIDLGEAITSIPFELTGPQQKSLTEILDDLRKGQPMNRLLQGDVGSGKTVVVAIAALLAAKQGYQVVFMAPTEVLAKQHYKTITNLFASLVSDWELNVGILTGNEASCFFGEGLETKKKKAELVKEIGKGDIKIIIGTHAVIQKDVQFKNLALAIIDEQHRFGVKQRAKFAADKKDLFPHFLSMSATPIPRTLSLTIFGDLDLSIINELPKGRQSITTKIVAPSNRKKSYEFIREQVKEGRQAFVICPRIEASEKEGGTAQQMMWNDVKAVKDEFENLTKNIFPDLVVGMLHGKMKGAEKNEIMSEFSKNKINILVSTSVIEIGVDIPNATIMMIEGAERFGLAQLYQFRGRVGRGEHKSFCFLFTSSSSSNAKQRLKSLVEAKNGFELAEKDLEIRGPGEFLGHSQTGLPDLAMNALNNMELTKAARETAEMIIKKDPALEKDLTLKEKLEQFQNQIHLE
jgi:ATP-dependent DNA helicase RecG